jgi:predicted phosphodiesterase
MRVALLSDVHANLAALEAVLAAAAADGAETAWHLGDAVGYGPDPDAVVTRLSEAAAVCVMGNHDAATCGQLGLAAFNGVAARAVEWTREHIAPETEARLAALPKSKEEAGFAIVHGTLRDPLWEYLMTFDAARAHFARQETRCSVVGHTHVPLAIRMEDGGDFVTVRPDDGEVLDVAEGRWCINPGGVGQPRDGDARSCYALLDTAKGTVTFRRIAYDIAATQRAIRERGLPDVLATRLARGR